MPLPEKIREITKKWRKTKLKSKKIITKVVMLRQHRQRCNTFAADRVRQYKYQIAFGFWSLNKSGIKYA